MSSYRSSYRTRAQREKQEKTKNIVLIVVLLIVIAAIGSAFAFFFFQEKTQYDKLTGCPLNSTGEIAPRGHTVVLIDETDQLTVQQKDFMQTYLRNFIKKDLNAGELLSIYALGTDIKNNRKPLFEMCKMRDGSDADALTENEKLMARQFKKKFEAPLAKKFDELMEPHPAAKQSPIFEMIQAIAVNSFAKHDVAGDRRLIIYSDMLHNTKGFSLYKSKNYDQFKNSNYYSELSFRLPDTEVDLYVFNTNPSLHKNNLIEFWKQFFKSKGAYINHVESTGR